MSTHAPVRPPEPAEKNKTGKDAPPDKVVECPKCHAVFQESTLIIPPPPAEYPKMLYKLVPKPKPPSPDEPQEELETTVVNNEDELKKDEAEGWSTEVPQPKDAKHEAKREEPNKKK